MSKSMLIMDTPDSCADCMLIYCDEIFDDEGYYRGDECICRANWPQNVNEWYDDETKPDWCPLIEISDSTKGLFGGENVCISKTEYDELLEYKAMYEGLC